MLLGAKHKESLSCLPWLYEVFRHQLRRSFIRHVGKDHFEGLEFDLRVLYSRSAFPPFPIFSLAQIVSYYLRYEDSSFPSHHRITTRPPFCLIHDLSPFSFSLPVATSFPFITIAGLFSKILQLDDEDRAFLWAKGPNARKLTGVCPSL